MIEAVEIKRRIYGRLEGLGLKEEKENIVFSFTAGRTSHLSAMSDEELYSLLEKLSPNQSNNENLAWARFDKKNKQHLYLLSMCIQLGWSVYNANVGRNVADLVRLGRWIKNFGAIKKPLLEQTRQELQKTVYQMEQMVTKHFKK
jgi:hypothetical protein